MLLSFLFRVLSSSKVLLYAAVCVLRLSLGLVSPSLPFFCLFHMQCLLQIQVNLQLLANFMSESCCFGSYKSGRNVTCYKAAFASCQQYPTGHYVSVEVHMMLIRHPWNRMRFSCVLWTHGTSLSQLIFSSISWTLNKTGSLLFGEGEEVLRGKQQKNKERNWTFVFLPFSPSWSSISAVMT